MNAFGKVPEFIDKGNMLRAILAIGKQDVDHKELIPFDTVNLIGSSSDHIIVDISDTHSVYEVGDVMLFRLTYALWTKGQVAPNKVAGIINTIKFLACRLDVGITAVARADCHDSARFLDPGGHDAARSMVLETAPDHSLTIGHQGGCQGIAGMTGQFAAIPTELQGFRAIDAPPG